MRLAPKLTTDHCAYNIPMQKIPLHIPPVNFEDFLYDLPARRIASYPLRDRDQSRLLHYHRGGIHHRHFYEIDRLLPDNSLLFFNDTKVIPARLHFQKSTGALIEIFLLQPEFPSRVISQAMQQTGHCVWSCMIGNLRRWPEGMVLEKTLGVKGKMVCLRAELKDRADKKVQFSWDDAVSFVDIVEAFGEVPLPPYLKRAVEEGDKAGYQTVYSKLEGAVAAPTAGLHFSRDVLNRLGKKGIAMDFLTLHVSAGTFQPVKDKNVLAHPMHSEQVQVSRQNITNLLAPEKKVIAVGTTSMRTLESLYWFGVKLLTGDEASFTIEKLYPYQFDANLPSRQEAMGAVLDHMDQKGIELIQGETEIFIFPGYHFKVCEGLVTNFHMPGSTLILLVAAFAGPDWRNIYQSALENDYRFLSYGDSSLLLPQ